MLDSERTLINFLEGAKMFYLKLTISLIIMILAGCSLINKNNELEYSQSNLESNLVLPQDLNHSLVADHYPIPRASSNHPVTERILLPPGSKITK